jgi:UDP-N-acetylmuramyl pentapeptide phosphotransferase/UDP-N-acetylglucosamine-1-phosphate transferase
MEKNYPFLQNQQVGETVRELGLAGQSGYANHGGLIIIFLLWCLLLFAKLQNIYVVLLIVTTLWMGTIGFIDDYIKIFKKDKQGLKEFLSIRAGGIRFNCWSCSLFQSCSNSANRYWKGDVLSPQRM